MTSVLLNNKRPFIIAGATKMFLQYGFNGCSMDKIAHAAPVSKATLYKYFDNKDALLAAVIENLCLNLFQVVDEVSIETESIENSLKKIAIAFVNLIFSKDALELYRLIIAECKNSPESGQLVYDSAPKIVTYQLKKYLQGLNQQGQISIVDIDFASEAFISLLKGDLHFQCLLGIKPRPSIEEKNQLVDQTVTLFMRGFVYVTQ